MMLRIKGRAEVPGLRVGIFQVCPSAPKGVLPRTKCIIASQRTIFCVDIRLTRRFSHQQACRISPDLT